jgi:hypothetical protein
MNEVTTDCSKVGDIGAEYDNLLDGLNRSKNADIGFCVWTIERRLDEGATLFLVFLMASGALKAAAG